MHRLPPQAFFHPLEPSMESHLLSGVFRETKSSLLALNREHEVKS